jgi:hypothetical protein
MRKRPVKILMVQMEAACVDPTMDYFKRKDTLWPLVAGPAAR